MKKQLPLAIALVISGAGVALADHNSRWGEGTALDPLGIHDDRIDSLDTAGDEPFGSAETGGGSLLDLIAFMRQDRPDTIDIDAADAGMGGAADAGGNSGAGNGGNGGGGRR